MLAGLADRALPTATPRCLPYCLLLLYGAGLEAIQHTLTYRVGSLPDLLADAVGLALYLGVNFFYNAKKQSKP